MQLWNQLEFMRLKHLKNSNFKTIYFKILVILAPWIENMADESMVVQVWSLDFHVQLKLEQVWMLSTTLCSF